MNIITLNFFDLIPRMAETCLICSRYLSIKEEKFCTECEIIMTNMLNDPLDLTDISVQKNRKKKDKETLKNRTIEDKSSKTKKKN